MLPGKLVALLNEMGYMWPKADEVKIFELGRKWLDFAGKLREIHSGATPHFQNVVAKNTDDSMDAFKQVWAEQESAPEMTKDGATGASVVGACLFVAAGVVLALKIAVIVQLVILLIQIIQAIAMAPPTFGASLAQIPIFKKLANKVIDMFFDRAIQAVLS